MQNSLSARLALTVVLGVVVPVITFGQVRNDRTTARSAFEISDALVSGSESRSVTNASVSTRPNSPAPSVVLFNWEGGYIGGHVGWGRGRADTTFTPLPAAPPFVDMGPASLRPIPRGFGGGAQGGYNWQRGHFVGGAEADITWSRMSGTSTRTPIIRNNGTPFPGGGLLTTHQDTKWFGTVRPRAGVALDRGF